MIYKKLIIITFSILFTVNFAYSQWLNWLDESPIAYNSHLAIVAADFNWDHLIDLAVAPNTGGIRIWYKTPSGWSSTPEIVTTSGTYRSLAAGDINYDGTIDLVGAGTTIQAFLHEFTGGGFIWTSANNFDPLPSGIFNSVTLANVNIAQEKYGCITLNDCDGLKVPFPYGLDIIATVNTGEGQGITVYRWAGYIYNSGNCEGSWEMEPVEGLPDAGYYNQVISANFNLDGMPDIAASKEGGIDVLFRSLIQDPGGCYMPDLGGNFIPKWKYQNGMVNLSDILPSTGNYKSIAAADINNDNYPDLVAVGNPTERIDAANGIEVWYGMPSNFDWLWFKEINVYDRFDYLLIPGNFTYVIIDDFHNDNIMDIAAGTVDVGIKVWRGQYYIDNPTLPCPPETNLKECPEPTKFYWTQDTSPISLGYFRVLASDDFNNDSKKDIAGARNDADSSTIGINAFLVTSPNTFSYSNWYHVNIDSFDDFRIFAGMKFSGTNNFSGKGENNEMSTLLGPDTDATAPMIIATVEDINTPNGESEIRIYKTDGEGYWDKLLEKGCVPVAEGELEDAQLVYLNNDNLFDVIAVKKTNVGNHDGIRAWVQISYCNFLEISSGLSTPGIYHELAIDDINNDGFKDIIAARQGSIELWCGSPELITVWNWVPCGAIGDGKNNRSIVAQDFNEDGYIDVVGCSYETVGYGGLTYYYQTDNGSQWGSEPIGMPFNCTRVFSTKYNTCLPDYNDEHYDVVASSADSGLLIFLHRLYDNNFIWEMITSPATNDTFSRALSADINNDGHSDILAWQNSYSSLMSYYWDCSAWHPTIIDTNFICTDMDTADLNNDTLPDLVSACQNTTTGEHVLRVGYSYSLPVPPVLVSPTNGSIVNTREPIFKMRTSSNYTNCLRFKISLEDGINLSIHNGAESPIGWDKICYNSSENANYVFQIDDTFPNGLPDGIYYWTVQAYDGFRNSYASNTYSFTVDPDDKIPPSEVQNILLEKIPTGVLLKWNKVPDTDVDRYRIFRGDNSTFPLIPSNMLAQISLPVGDVVTFIDNKPLSPLNAFYKVKAVDVTGNVGP